MRGDVSLTARLLLRREARPGLGVAVGGATMVVASLLPWGETLARVSMLGTTDERVTATLRGVPGEPRAWVVAALGILCLVSGLGAALDRPQVRPVRLAAAALTAAALASWALVVVGPTAAHGEADGSGLLDLAAELPVGVDVVVVTIPGSGPALAILGAALALVGAATAGRQ